MNSAGDLFVTRVRTEQIEKWLSELLKTRKPATANCLLRHTKTFFNYAVKLNYIRDNPGLFNSQFDILKDNFYNGLKIGFCGKGVIHVEEFSF